MTRTASTRRTGNPARTSPASGPGGRAPSGGGRPSTRRRTGDGVHPTVDESRSVVITGASRGLGLASAAHLHRQGWTVVAAMRTPEVGLDRLRSVAGAAAGDPRLRGVRLDLDDPVSIAAAAQEILDTV